jgi:hypothetical protein
LAKAAVKLYSDGRISMHRMGGFSPEMPTPPRPRAELAQGAGVASSTRKSGPPCVGHRPRQNVARPPPQRKRRLLFGAVPAIGITPARERK